MLQEQLVCIFIYLKSSFVPSLDPSRCLSSSSSAPRPYLDGEERAATFSANTNPSRLNVWLTPVTPLLSNSTATQTEISFWQSDRTVIRANARNWVFWGGEWEKKLKCPKNSLLPRKRQQQKTKDRECICAFCLWLSRHTGFEGSSPLEGSAHWPVAGIKKSNHFTAMSSELSTDVLEKKDIKGRKEVKSTMLAYFLQLLLNYFSGLWRNTSTYRKAWRNEFIPGILFSLQSRFLFVLLEDTLPCELEQTRPQFVDPNSANSPQLSMSQSGKLSFAMKIKPRKSSLDILSIFVFFFWQNPIKSSRKISSWSLFPDW